MIEVNRYDNETFRLLYSEQSDKFWQLQESLNECSLFVGKSIMKGKLSQNYFNLETRVYVVSEFDPIFLVLPYFNYQLEQQQLINKGKEEKKFPFEDVNQLIENLKTN